MSEYLQVFLSIFVLEFERLQVLRGVGLFVFNILGS